MIDSLSMHRRRCRSVTVTTPAVDPTLGDIFVSLDAGSRAGRPDNPLAERADLASVPLPAETKAFDLNAVSYSGKPVLTWWQGQVVEVTAKAKRDRQQQLHPIVTVMAGNGLRADLP